MLLNNEDPKVILHNGQLLLEPLLKNYNFIFKMNNAGIGSGGKFACGSYTRSVKGWKKLWADERKIELHFRYSLGLVTYHIGDYHLEHEIYMKFLDVQGKALYPGFSNDPLDGFRHLKHDLENFCLDFLSGDGRQFKAYAKEYINNPDKFSGGFF